MSINPKLTSMFNDVKPMNDASVEINVEMNPSSLMEHLAKETLNELTRLVPYAGYVEVSELTYEDILHYFCTLVWMRCQYVVESSSKAYTEYKTLAKYIAIPVVFDQLLLVMGRAYDSDFALRFIPQYTISEDCLLAPSEVRAISDLFTRMEKQGLKVVYGMPNDRNGELDFMALCHVEGVVKGYRRSHPVYGFLAAFFEQKKWNEITGMMCRVFYGYRTDYEMHIARFFSVSDTVVQHVRPDEMG